MKILPPAIATSKLNHLLQIQKKAGLLPPLSVGEVVEAKIMETPRYGKALILLKNHSVMANSELVFRKGETVEVRVTQLHPKVILHIVQNKMSQNSRLMKTRSFPAAEKLAGFIRSSLKTIDSHQVINYMFQEYEGKYMFQIPLLFPEKFGLAEIFVKFRDQESQGKGRRGEKSVLFLLNMDALGDMVVEAKIKTEKIGCVLKCGNETVCDFIRPFLKELGDRLTALGYEIDYLKCVTEKDNLKTKSEHSEFKNPFALEGVDILA